MTLRRLATALRRDESGYSLTELLTVMVILSVVMGALTTMLVSGSRASIDMNLRVEAQTELRLGLDRLRREAHCASLATSGTASVTLTLATTCPTSQGNTSITWCTVGSGTRYGLWRYAGGACSGTGVRVADYLTTATVFGFTPQSATSLAKLAVDFPISLTPGAGRAYRLTDEIVLRNSTRT